MNDLRENFEKTAETKEVVLNKVSQLLQPGLAREESQRLYDLWNSDYDQVSMVGV